MLKSIRSKKKKVKTSQLCFRPPPWVAQASRLDQLEILDHPCKNEPTPWCPNKEVCFLFQAAFVHHIW